MHQNLIATLINGILFGLNYNAWYFKVERNVGSSLLVISDLSVADKQGNGKWMLRVDSPHWYVNYYHLNINSDYSGVPSPHTHLPVFIAQALSIAGDGVQICHEIAPYLYLASIILEFDTAHKSYQKNKILGILLVIYSVYWNVIALMGSCIGSRIGTWICPGIGSLIGGLIGALSGVAFVDYDLRDFHNCSSRLLRMSKPNPCVGLPALIRSRLI